MFQKKINLDDPEFQLKQVLDVLNNANIMTKEDIVYRPEQLTKLLISQIVAIEVMRIDSKELLKALEPTLTEKGTEKLQELIKKAKKKVKESYNIISYKRN